MPLKNNLQEVAEVTGINATILSVTTFTNLELGLKIALLLISIIYTADKYRYHLKERKKNKK